MIAITIDIDWSPDEVVAPLLDELESLGIPVTVNCTDPATDGSGKSGNLAGRIAPRHEIGLHPNFTQRGACDPVWESLRAAYPMARGFRAHRRTVELPFVEGAGKNGMRYEVVSERSVATHPQHAVVRDVDEGISVLATDFWDSAYAQGDGAAWDHRKAFSSAAANDGSKIVIAGFHPQILYYDIRSAAEYQRRKQHYHAPVAADFVPMARAVGPKKLLRDLARDYPRDRFTTISGFLDSQGGGS